MSATNRYLVGNSYLVPADQWLVSSPAIMVVVASDYDTLCDEWRVATGAVIMQRQELAELRDELENIKRSWGLILSQRDALAAERSWAETELPKWRDLAKETRIERDELRAQVEVMMPALEKISAYAPCSGVKDPGLTKMYMGILARDAIAAALQEPKP